MADISHAFMLDDAKKYGVNQAVFLFHLKYLIQLNRDRKSDKHLHDGYYWTYQTLDDLKAAMPYFTRRQIDTIIKKLTELGVLIKGNFNEKKYDRTLWYSISQFGEMDFTEVGNGFHRNVTPIPYTNPDTNHDIRSAESHPTLEEVISYVDSLKEKGITIHLLASEWFHKMDAMDWRYKGKAVKNWKLTYQNWNNNQAIFAKRDAKKLDSDKDQRFTTQYI